jgi:Flp pilus assembly protein TadB
MEIIKFATEWAKAEVFSARFFIFFALLLLVGSAGFWQLGKTEVARSFITPSLVTGILLLAVGVGIFYANKSRITSFQEAYEKDPQAFVQSEILRTDKSLGEYRTIVFKVIPMIIVVAALLIVFFQNPSVRAASILTIGMMVVILLVDSNANARLQEYRAELEKVA